MNEYQRVEAINQEHLVYLIHAPFQHGVISLERIITSGELGQASVFEPYHLPPTDVLQIHMKGLNHETTNPVWDFVWSLKGYEIGTEAVHLKLR